MAASHQDAAGASLLARKGPIRHVLILRGLLPAKEEALMRAWAIADVI